MTASIDPITAAVIQGALENIAIEMGHKLMRMSYSSIIRESEDFGTALTDYDGNQLCECKMSTPLQSGPIPGYIRGIKRALAARSQDIRPGDVIMHNDPYGGASHGPDVAFIVPIFIEEKLVAFSVTTAHHLDIGAATPGSAGIVDAVDAYAEGLQFKAIKVVEEGRPNAQVWQILRDNIRAPQLVVGDMEAQIKAAEIGAARFLELADRYGIETIRAAAADLMDYSERLMRDAIRALPDGSYAAEGIFDGFSDDPNPMRRDLPIKVTVTVAGDDITVDLTGTAPQVPDRPINMPFEGTVDCAIWLTLRSILLDSVEYGEVPQNAGLTRPIKIIAPKGCLANPIFPAPTIARFTPGNLMADTLMRALSQIVPEKVSAGVGNLRVVSFSGLREGQHWVHMEILEGSYGGRFGMNGMDAVDTLYANTRNNPIEDMETHLPLRVEQYELRGDTPAAGQWRGGIGSIREFTLLSDGAFSTEGDGHGQRPWPLGPGEAGLPGALALINADGTREALPSKVPYHQVHAGDRIVALGPNGGGYGDPLARDPAAVLDDVLDGLMDGETALTTYGVVIRENEIDAAATSERRAKAGGVKRMRAIYLGTPGEQPGTLELTDRPAPKPGPGEVLVETAYGGCNFADTMMWRGTYPHPKGYPLVAGLEMSGRVAALGPDVTNVAIGDRVASFIEDAGAFAEFCVAPANKLIPIPDAVGLDQAAAFTIQALTAWHMLHNVSKVQSGDIVLVHAIGGGVGLYLTQMAVAAGATVLGTIGTPGKEKRPLELGAAGVVNRDEADFVVRIAEIAGRPIDKIYDSTGATILDRSFALVRNLGHIVSFGEAEGRPLPNLWERLVTKSLTFSRFHLGHVDFDSDIWRISVSAVTEAVKAGDLSVPIEGVFAFDEVAKMYERLESRQVPGKLLLAINPSL